MDPSQTSNPYNPNPSSILWAHQLRADIVNLTSSISNLHGSHASTTKILTDFGGTVDRLHARIHALEVQRDADKLSLAQRDARLTELSVSHNEELGSYKDIFDDIRARLEKTELVNQTLQRRIEILERPFSAAREKKSVGKVTKRNKRVASSERSSSETGLEDAAWSAQKFVRTSSDKATPVTTNPQHLLRTETGTTWATSLSDVGQPLFRRKGSNLDLQLQLPNQTLNIDSAEAAAVVEAQLIKRIRQSGQSLADYLEYAIALRSEAPQISDFKFTQAFILGHDEVPDRIWSDGLAREAGYTWERLVEMIRSHLISYQGQISGHSGDQGGPGFDMRNRRTIPIIPPDTADDALSVIMPYRAGGG